MKTTLLLGALLLWPILVRADVTLVQKIESAALAGNCTIKIKGSLARIDLPMPAEMGTGTTTSIIDLGKGKITLLNAATKVAIQDDLRSALKDTAASGGANEEPKATGAQEKIGDWEAEIYEATEDGAKEKFWVAKDFPDAAAILAEFKKFENATSSKLGFSRLLASNLPGIRVKLEAVSPDGKVTITTVSASIAPVPASEFVAPPGYRKVGGQSATATTKKK
jgi:Domain of unknown function (DUF4412)